MSRRDFSEVMIPAQIVEIGAWAFAYCEHLKKIYIPTSVKTFGQDVFQGCTALQDIIVYEAASTDTFANHTAMTAFFPNGPWETLSRLTAISFTHFHQPALRCLSDVGTAEWLSMWNHTLLDYLNQPDAEGFDPFLAGGEEDYEDKNSNLDYFCHIRRIQKVTCSIERLLVEQDYPLSPAIRTQLTGYLKKHSFWSLNSNTPSETIDVLLAEDNRISSLFKLYEALNLLEHIHIPDLISTLSPEQVELKALLMKHSRQTEQKSNPWDSFTL